MTAAVRFVVALLALLAPLALAAAMLSLSEWAGADQGHTESLHIAILDNDLENVVHLLETHNARPTYDRILSHLYSAVSQGVHSDILATLTATLVIASVYMPGNRFTSRWLNVEETFSLLLIRAIGNANSGAVGNANSGAVRFLIEGGANVNSRHEGVVYDYRGDPDGTRIYTLLRWNAEWQGGAEIRDMLIAAGAHWGTECRGRAVVNPAWFVQFNTPPCVCLPPDVRGTPQYSDGRNCERRDTPAECERLGGDLQSAGGEADRICSGVDWNDTFCILGSADAFPCAYFFAHVKACNALNRPALDPWHCGPVCPNRGFAIGAACTKTPPLRGNED